MHHPQIVRPTARTSCCRAPAYKLRLSFASIQSRRFCVTRSSSDKGAKAQTKFEGADDDLNCVATGMDVECSIDEGDNPRSFNNSQSSASTSEAECVATGLDVECAIPDTPSPSTSQPPSALDALLSNPIVSTALLVSPFFFWGTGMVAMKGVFQHTTPLFVGVLRLLPAGAVLVAWAAARGRPQPSSAIAWAWIAAFGLVDGAAFQVSLHACQHTPYLHIGDV